MCSNRHATDFQDTDGVAAEALGGPSVEEFGVLVALDDRVKFSALLQVSSPCKDQPLKGGPAGDTKQGLLGREGTGFFKQIKKINDELAVVFE
jgi:hypothetical protein